MLVYAKIVVYIIVIYKVKISQRKPKLLLIGGTGNFGYSIVRLSQKLGFESKCVVRELKTARSLRGLGVELVYGNLSRPSTIPASLRGIDVVINAAGARGESIEKANSIYEIDGRGCVALIEAAKVASVKKFIYLSVVGANDNLLDARLSIKATIERKVRYSGLNYTILVCGSPLQILLAAYAIPILTSQKVETQLLKIPEPYIDTRDVAAVTFLAIMLPSLSKKTINPLATEILQIIDIIQICEKFSGNTAQIIYLLPDPVLRAIGQFLHCFQFTWAIANGIHRYAICVSPQTMFNNDKSILAAYLLTVILRVPLRNAKKIIKELYSLLDENNALRTLIGIFQSVDTDSGKE